MKTPSLAAGLALLCLVGGCDFRAKAEAERKHVELEARIAELDMRLERFESENRELRTRMEALVAVTPIESLESCTGGDGSYRISRSRVDALFADTSALASQARIVPTFENGKATGFKLFSIRPSSVYSRCGFQNGDTVTSLNGMDINSPEKALDAYSKLKGSTQVVVAIVRQGKPLTVTIDVDP